MLSSSGRDLEASAAAQATHDATGLQIHPKKKKVNSKGTEPCSLAIDRTRLASGCGRNHHERQLHKLVGLWLWALAFKFRRPLFSLFEAVYNVGHPEGRPDDPNSAHQSLFAKSCNWLALRLSSHVLVTVFIVLSCLSLTAQRIISFCMPLLVFGMLTQQNLSTFHVLLICFQSFCLVCRSPKLFVPSQSISKCVFMFLFLFFFVCVCVSVCVWMRGGVLVSACAACVSTILGHACMGLLSTSCRATCATNREGGAGALNEWQTYLRHQALSWAAEGAASSFTTVLLGGSDRGWCMMRSSRFVCSSS